MDWTSVADVTHFGSHVCLFVNTEIVLPVNEVLNTWEEPKWIGSVQEALAPWSKHGDSQGKQDFRRIRGHKVKKAYFIDGNGNDFWILRWQSEF